MPNKQPIRATDNQQKDTLEQLELASQVIEQARDHLEEAAAVLEDTRVALEAERDNQDSSGGSVDAHRSK